MSKKILSKFTIYIFIGFLFYYLFSFLGFVYPWLNNLLYFLILGTLLYLYLKNFDAGFIFSLFLLLSGSDGHLFEFQDISINFSCLIITLVFSLVKIFKLRIERKYLFSLGMVSLFIGLAIVRGFLLGHTKILVIRDGINYAYLLLLISFLLLNKKKVFKVLQAVIGSSIGVVFFTLFALFLFSTKLQEWGGVFYSWLRESVVGKSVFVQNDFYRVMFSSQIFLLLAIALCLSLFSLIKKGFGKYLILATLFEVGLFIRYSRALWIGIAVIILFILFFSKRKWIFLILVIVLFLVSNLLILTVCGRGLLQPNILSGRLETIVEPEKEQSSFTRLMLLPKILEKIKQHPILGNGLGLEVEYKSLVTQEIEKTFHLDWGYLELWAELGFLGLLSYLIFIVLIIQNGFKTMKEATFGLNKKIVIGGLASIFGLLVCSITGPFVFYPLGIIYLLLDLYLFRSLKTLRDCKLDKKGYTSNF